MKITVHTDADGHFTLDVDQEATIAEVKNKLAEKVNHHVSQVELNQAIFVDDDKKLADYNVHDGSELYLFIDSKWKIIIQMPYDLILKIPIDPESRISCIKEIIEAKTEMKCEAQELFLNGSKLDDASIVSQSGIQIGSILTCRGKLELSVNISGKQIVIHTHENVPVSEIKHEIAVLESFRFPSCKLMFQGKELDDNKLLRDYGINHESVIDCIEEPYTSENDCIEIIVKTLTGKEYVFKLERAFKILDLKLMMQYLEKRPVRQLRFIFGGKQLEVNRTLRDYNIQNGCTIHSVLCLCGC